MSPAYCRGLVDIGLYLCVISAERMQFILMYHRLHIKGVYQCLMVLSWTVWGHQSILILPVFPPTHTQTLTLSRNHRTHLLDPLQHFSSSYELQVVEHTCYIPIQYSHLNWENIKHRHIQTHRIMGIEVDFIWVTLDKLNSGLGTFKHIFQT